jgi:hypothetical protein
MNQTKQKTNTVSFRAKTGLLARISGIEARADKRWFVLLWMAAAFLGVTFGEAKSGFAAQVKYNDLSSINADTPSEHFGSVVDVEATVTFVNDMREFIFVQDGDDGIFVYRPEMGNVTIGQRVRVVGELAKGDLMPIVISPKVSVIGEGDLPKSPKISEITLDHDCLYLSLAGPRRSCTRRRIREKIFTWRFNILMESYNPVWPIWPGVALSAPECSGCKWLADSFRNRDCRSIELWVTSCCVVLLIT